MKDLSRLVKTLKPKEIQLIRNIYRSQSTGSSKENMCLKLFNQILTNKILNNKDAYFLIGSNRHISVISQAKKKLESDILNMILISSISDAKENFRNSNFTCQKNLLLGRILIDRGLTDKALRLLQLTSKEAEKAELPEIKMSCDDILRSTYIDEDIKASGEQYKESEDISVESFSGIHHAKSINYPFLYAKSFSDPFDSFNLDLEKLTINIKRAHPVRPFIGITWPLFISIFKKKITRMREAILFNC
jgi:hypothetical protein